MTGAAWPAMAIEHRRADGLVLRERTPPPKTTVAGTILYLHGLGESSLCFTRLIADCRLDAWQHVAPDLPGYGRSPWRDGPLSFTAQAAWWTRWLASRAEGPVVLLGHSMGGALATLIAEAAPARVQALVNVEGNGSLEDCATISRRIAEGYDLERFLAGGFDEVAGDIYRNGGEDLPYRGYYASLRFCDPRQLYRDSVELVAMSRAEDLPARMAALDMPCRYLFGEPHGISSRTLTLLDRAGIVPRAIPRSGHWPYLDEHDRFVDELLAFLADPGG